MTKLRQYFGTYGSNTETQIDADKCILNCGNNGDITLKNHNDKWGQSLYLPSRYKESGIGTLSAYDGQVDFKPSEKATICSISHSCNSFFTLKEREKILNSAQKFKTT